MWIIQIFTFIGDESHFWYSRWNCTVNAVDKTIWSFCASISELCCWVTHDGFVNHEKIKRVKFWQFWLDFKTSSITVHHSITYAGFYLHLYFSHLDFQLWFEHNHGKCNTSTTQKKCTNKYEKMQKTLATSYWI